MGNDFQRMNCDKRECRKQRKKSFKAAIVKWKDAKRMENQTYFTSSKHSHKENVQHPTLNLKLNNASSQKHSKVSSTISIYVRKRPLFESETENDFDVVNIEESTRSVQVINALMYPDLRMKIRIHPFQFSNVFNENTTSDVVYESTVKPLVKHTLSGGQSTCFMYGATGSGKTFTMTAIQEQVCNELQSLLGTSFLVSMKYYELQGSHVTDLLDNTTSPKILQDANQMVHCVGCFTFLAHDGKELHTKIKEAIHNRATCATGVHDKSSRSHAICELKIIYPIDEFASTHQSNDSTLKLIDLAGSERNKDSMYHDARMRKECIEINKSLLSLKECARAIQTGSTYMPYRSSKLTQILKNSFEDKNSKLSVIATVSPSSADTEHTLNTLESVSKMKGNTSKNLSELYSVDVLNIEKS